MLSRLAALPRRTALALSAVPVLALIGVTVFAPLPFAVAQPGSTEDVLADHKGEQVITVEGAPTRPTQGKLLMTTIAATAPDTEVDLGGVVDAWFRTDRAVMPREAVYPTGDTTEEIEKHNRGEMRKSQDDAVAAALNYLDESPEDVRVELQMEDIGGPSAGLLFTLGIIDKLDGDSSGGDLTGGRTIAGTGTITADGKVGPVGGVALKTQAAGRDGASVFLVPKPECADAKAELPDGVRLIPVTTLDGAVDALRALDKGGKVPSC
ncbi:S16 family serine protease [Streptomyces sp. LHD-70]|uniref:S16 family serine protease n=1 Tax=Streptomyces sp. LHD-70 TaxID=3072140 RepID=UPI00280FE428|nr:S16 family serine protease [Streptomyces sp. LHD-70]MDQ8705748.1 S16 family serine protease [Streptomyces sp. LHD-70]